MNRKTLAALMGAFVLALVSAGAAIAAAGSGPAVSVTVKTTTKTLLKATTVHGEKGWITKGGTPRGKCPGSGGAGALDAATHGKWTGSYSKSIGGTFITSILGVKPKSNQFWEIVVNGKPANVGICLIKLKAGEKLLFKIAK
jgi:Domain of unknown function (DUF4430)